MSILFYSNMRRMKPIFPAYALHHFGLKKARNGLRMCPLILNADSKAIVDVGIASMSLAILDKILYFLSFTFHQFNKSNESSKQFLQSSNKYLSTLFFNCALSSSNCFLFHFESLPQLIYNQHCHFLSLTLMAKGQHQRIGFGYH